LRSRVKKIQVPPGDDSGRPKTKADLIAENAALRDRLAALETSRADAPPTAGESPGAADLALTDRTRQLEAVRIVSEEITRELNLSSLLNLILQRAVDLVGAVGGTILFWDAAAQVLIPQVHSELFGALEWQQIPSGVGVVGRVAATRQGLRVNDYRVWSEALSTALVRTGVTASMAEPLLYRDTLVGVINVVHTDGRATFTEHDAHTLRLFANQAAIAIENARLHEAAQREIHERQQTESTLRQRESQYRRIVETATEGIWALDADNRTTFVNGTMADMLGHSAQELLGRSLFDFIAEEDRPRSAAAMERRRQGVAEQIERVFVRKDGTRLVALANISPIYGESGQYAGSFGMLTDITARRQAEQTLADRTRQLDALRLVSEEITRELDLDRLLGLITQRAIDLVAGMGGGVYLWDEATQLVIPHTYHGAADSRGKFPRRLGEGLVGHVARARQGMIVNDYRAASFAHPRTLDASGISAVLAEPLLYRERLLGVIAVHHEGGARVFTAQDQETLRLFATQAAIAIENARLFASAQHELTERARAEEALSARTRQLEAARRTTIDITRELNLSALLDLLVDQAVDLIAVRSGTLFLWDDAAGTLASRVTSGLGEWFGDVRLALGEGVAGAVAQQRMGLIVNDYRSSPHTIPWFVERTDVTAVLGEPLLYRDRLVGVILLRDRRDRQSFTADDQGLLRLFAAQAAIAIENAQLYEATRRRAEHFATLNDIARTLATTLDPQRVAEQALRAVRVLLPEAAARFWEHGPEDGVFRHVAGIGVRDRSREQPVRFTPGEGLLGLTLTTRRPVISRDVTIDPRYREKAGARAQGFTSCVMLPLLVADRVSGVLAIFTHKIHDFSEEELALLSAFAAQVAVALENARLFAELRRAYHDVQRAQDELVRSEKLRALGQMAAGMAHDLNNVLAAVLGQAELLRLRIPDPVVHESLGTLVTAATDGAQIVRRLQDFARQQPGRPATAVDLASAVREALEITSSRWKDEPQQRGLVIRVETALDALPPILGHATEIREALTNLILNAVDAMPQGGTLTLAARAVPLAAEGQGSGGAGETHREGPEGPSPQPPSAPAPLRFVELTVTDSGVGMAEDIRRRIFDPFFTTKGVKGSGLGLSVVYGIMQRHQGSIDVVSAPGRGTTFVLRFQAAPAAAALPQPPGEMRSFPPRRLLLIDDESTVRQTLSALLRAAGHHVTESNEGAKGLTHLDEHPVDLVLTDLGMPEMSGWDVTRAVKAVNPRLPVILLTGWGEHPASQADHPSLVDRILGKPVRLDELLVAIEQLTAPDDRGPDASAAGPASS
jgi:PAS domain S-box-containing protein